MHTCLSYACTTFGGSVEGQSSLPSFSKCMRAHHPRAQHTDEPVCTKDSGAHAQQAFCESTLPISGIRQGLTEFNFSPHSTSTAQKSIMRIMAELNYQNPANPSPTWMPGSGSFSFCTIPEICKHTNVKRCSSASPPKAMVRLTSRMRLPNFVRPSDRLSATTSPISKAVRSAK